VVHGRESSTGPGAFRAVVDLASSAKAFFVIRSSSEWYDMTASRPARPWSAPVAVTTVRPQTSNSALTSMRKAWNVRLRRVVPRFGEQPEATRRRAVRPAAWTVVNGDFLPFPAAPRWRSCPRTSLRRRRLRNPGQVAVRVAVEHVGRPVLSVVGFIRHVQRCVLGVGRNPRSASSSCMEDTPRSNSNGVGRPSIPRSSRGVANAVVHGVHEVGRDLLNGSSRLPRASRNASGIPVQPDEGEAGGTVPTSR